MTGWRVRAPAKLNLSLRVGERDGSGLHPVSGLFLTVDHCDLIYMRIGDRDRLRVIGDPRLPDGGDNLVWKAIAALREATGADAPVEAELLKRIPAAAGLGGGSSDAAAALLAYRRLAVPAASPDECDLDEIAGRVGADVPFCLRGGLRFVSGYGERLGPPLPLPGDFAAAAAVPPAELPTARVYETWDRLAGGGGAGPPGEAAREKDLPPSLREYGPLGNDLYPAATRLAPEIDDWRAELSARWDRPVLMSGSGPALYGLFADREEAAGGLALVPEEARSAFTAAPVARGAAVEEDPAPE